MKCTNVTDFGVALVASKCTMLRTLNVRGCIQLTDMSISACLLHCKLLRSFSVASLLKVTPAAFFTLRTSAKAAVGDDDDDVDVDERKTTAAGIRDETGQVARRLTAYCTLPFDKLEVLNVYGMSFDVVRLAVGR